MTSLERRVLLLLVGLALASTASGFAADVNVRIRTWKIPPASHYPHDPLVAQDGSIWYTARYSNTIGRFDPKSEQFKEYVTNIPNSGPHGIVQDKDGIIWFTAIDAKPTYLGRLDPRTGQFREFPVKLPAVSVNDPSPASAHTLTLDGRGNIWFTLLGSDMVGRFNIKMEQTNIARSPQHPAGPYGIVVNEQGVPFFTLMRTNKIGAIDPETMAVRLYEIPNPAARPRRPAITPDGAVWYTDFERGMLGRLDLKSGKFDEWPSPGGAWSRPYAIYALGNVIWYNESWLTPSTIVRFDPETHQFRSWPVADCDDGIYQFVADGDRNLWFTCHGTDRIGKVEILDDPASKNSGAAGK